MLFDLYWAIKVQIASFHTSSCDSALCCVVRGCPVSKLPVHVAIALGTNLGNERPLGS